MDARVFDARGNGDGLVANTITGNHNGHISDYTSLVVFNAHDLLTRDVRQTVNDGKNDAPGVQA